jgi:type I restriction enzyme, S subunit
MTLSSSKLPVRLSEIARVQSGAGFPDKYQSGRNLDFPFYKVSDMNLPGNEIEMTNETNSISEETRRILGATVFPKGSVIFPKVGGAIATNKKRLVTRNCCVDNNVMGVIPDTNKIDSRLLFYFFLAHDLSEFANDAGLPSIRKTTVEDWLIGVIPPLPEQQRIVGILDAAFDGIATAKANAEKNLQNARALFESHLQSVFTQRGEGWMKNKLAALTTKIGSGATPRGGEESYKSEGISLIRSLNVHDFGFRYRKLAFLDDAQANELSNVEVQPCDVLLNITGASVARCCIVPEDVLPARVNQHVSIIRPIADKLDANFLHYLLISKTYKDQLLQTGSEGGSTRQAITKAQIQDFTIEYPATIAEQKAIVVKLDTMLIETHRLESLYQRKLATLDELKKILLHQAFSGEL